MYVRIIFVIVACIALAGCATTPITVLATNETDLLAVDVATKQTEITATAKDIEANIDAVKIITDDAKITGEIPKDKTACVIKYVDTSAILVKKLNGEILGLTKLNAEYAKSRITDNANHARIIASKDAEIKTWAARADWRLKWAVMASVVAISLFMLVVFYIIKS